MAEADRLDMMMRLLRDIRETQSDQGSDIRALRKSVEEWQETTATMAGFAVHANVRQKIVSEDVDNLRQRVTACEAAQ